MRAMHRAAPHQQAARSRRPSSRQSACQAVRHEQKDTCAGVQAPIHGALPVAQLPSSCLAAPCSSRRALLQLSIASVLLSGTQAGRAVAAAEPSALASALFSAGEWSFLEAVFNDLQYAGVREVVPGYIGTDKVVGVRVTYDPSRITYASLLKSYWRNVRPTQADGQFDRKGAAYASAIWVTDDAQRQAAEATRAKLQSSGVFGKELPLVTPVLEAPLEFEPAPAEERGLGQRDRKRLDAARKKSGRTAYYESIWGMKTFCKDRVCGYVQFAKACTDECLDVFPEYRDQPGMFSV